MVDYNLACERGGDGPCGSHLWPAFGTSTLSGPRLLDAGVGNDAFRTPGADARRTTWSTRRRAPRRRGRPAGPGARGTGDGGGPMRVCVIGASGELGRHMVRLALDGGHDVVAVCREQSVPKLAEFAGRITLVPGATDDREVIKRAVAGCDGVL